MKILQLDSSITGDRSLTRHLGKIALEIAVSQVKGATITYLDLVKEPLPHLTLAIMAARADRRGADAVTLDALVAHEKTLDTFLDADLIIVGAPMYNFGIASQLKTWLDTLAVAGRTFRYRSDRVAEGLCKGKRVLLISARGNIYSIPSPLAKLDHQESYLIDFFTFLGVDRVDIVRAEGVASSAEKRESALAAGVEAIRELIFNSASQR